MANNLVLIDKKLCKIICIILYYIFCKLSVQMFIPFPRYVIPLYLMGLEPDWKKSPRIAECKFGYLKVCSLIIQLSNYITSGIQICIPLFWRKFFQLGPSLIKSNNIKICTQFCSSIIFLDEERATLLDETGT